MSDTVASVENRGRRWLVCGLLFAATTVNYVDRQMIGLLKPVISGDLGWSETDYADVVFWFQAAYAIGYLLMGRFVDRVGARVGYAIAFTIWSIGQVSCGLARSVTEFAAARFVLGFGEAGNFPAGVKAVTEWFAPRERALAVGLFNAGSNVGAIVAPLLTPILVLSFGWRMAFVFTGAASLIWLVAWIAIYRSPPRPASDPLEGPAAIARVSWRTMLRQRATWAFVWAKLLTDPIWYLLLFWTPDFLAKSYGLDIAGYGPPLVVIYLMADAGSIAGGWASSRAVRRGAHPVSARKRSMLVAALLVTPIMFAQGASNLWLAVAIIGLAAAGHQAWSANLMTLPADLVPSASVGSLLGIGGMAGAIGGMVMAKATGAVLAATGSYTLIFIVAAGAYLVALAGFSLITRGLTPHDA